MLLALDRNGTKVEKGKYGPDAMYPISWARDYGKGRTFYCSLGHRDEIFWNAGVMAHYLAGIQYALGDLPANAKPVSPAKQAEAAPMNRPPEGFVALFDGKSLDGWFGHGTKDPRELWKMSPEELKAHKELNRLQIQ